MSLVKAACQSGMNTPELRKRCATGLNAASARASQLKSFIGFDGFVDTIMNVVDKRESAVKYDRIPSIAKFAERIGRAAGMSTNMEMVVQQVKFGGNGPLMANAMVSFGLKLCYLGNLGYPEPHPIFHDFTKRGEVYSVLEPGYTDALEFDDGKLMFGKLQALREFSWQTICERFGREKLITKLNDAQFIAFVDWAHFTSMSSVWEAILKEVCPALTGPRRRLFFDLADPEKRTAQDILAALKLIGGFQQYFDVILGLNEKESSEVGKVLGFDTSDHSPEGLAAIGGKIREQLAIDTVVIHPVSYAVAVSEGDIAIVEGPFTPKPLITTGAGDHFNAGFCLGKLFGFDNALSVLAGVATSGFYVRTGQSPAINDLTELLNNWPSM